MPAIYDTHAHVDQLEDLDLALKEANEAGVSVIAVGVDLASNKKNLEIRNKYPSLIKALAFGIHPGNININEIEICINFIRDNIFEVKAIGEIGLDFWYKWVKKDKEKKGELREVFNLQLDIAKEFNLPVVIHSRGAWEECYESVKEKGIKKAEFHWYSGPVDILKKILGSGYFISATPSLAYSPQAKEAVSYAPIEQTLIETDSPVYFKDKDKESGFKSAPKDIFKTLELYRELKKIDKDEALSKLNKNAEDFFGLGL